MNRKMYQPTKNQEAKWNAYGPVEMPSDDEFKARWAKSHGGKTRGWGLKKRDWVLSNMANTREYQEAIWQGRVDFLQGISYQADENEENASAYNLGYYRGYTNCMSDLGGFDAGTVGQMLTNYLNNVGQFTEREQNQLVYLHKKAGLEVA